MGMGRILVAEDYEDMRENLIAALEDREYEVEGAVDGQEALSMLKESGYDLVLSDLRMPNMDGLELLRETRKLARPPAFIMITAHGSIPDAVEAMNLGAVDFVEKPFNLDELEYKVANAIGTHAPVGAGESPLDGVIGSTPQMLEIASYIRSAAESDLPMLLRGEAGTGKHLIAKALHDLSGRAEGPFIAYECSAPGRLGLEADVFGYEKGAFPEAKARHAGVMEEANGGTVFLDGIETLSLPAQFRLMRYLEDKAFEREGGNRMVESDVRIVCATTKELAEMVKEGAFREDLFYKLTVKAEVPPLRERMDDLSALIDHFLAAANAEHERDVDLSPRVRKLLGEYHWPGNVAEVSGVISRCVAIAAGDTLTEAELPDDVRNPRERGEGSLTESVESYERDKILRALERHAWNQTHAAAALKIGRTALQYKMQKYNLKKAGEK